MKPLVADYLPGELIKIEFPSVGTTGALGPCLGLGFYNPNLNIGYLLHRMPVYDSPREMIFSEVNSKLSGNRSEFYILAAGLRYLFIDRTNCFGNFYSDECGKELHSEARNIDDQLDSLLGEMGFDLQKLTRRYNGQNGIHETGFVTINTLEGFAEIRTAPVLSRNARRRVRYKVEKNK